MEKLRSFKRSDGSVFAEVHIDHELNALVDKWIGDFETQENFRTVALFIVSVLEDHELTCWLADHRFMIGSFDESMKFLIQTIRPRVLNTNLKREAIVLPSDAFAKLSTSTAILNIKNYKLQHFQDYNEARSWLRRTLSKRTGS